MPIISAQEAGDLKVCAFLDMIAWSEGTSEDRHRTTQFDGYDVIVTGSDGPEIFTDFSTHPFANGRPAKHITGTLFSSASGRYQFLRTHWVHYRDLLLLPDFGPLSQDKWAIRLIRERRALVDIENGNIYSAIQRCANIWASFPGAGYDQPENKMEKLIQVFNEKLRLLTAPAEIPDAETDMQESGVVLLLEIKHDIDLIKDKLDLLVNMIEQRS